MSIEAMKQALEAFEVATTHFNKDRHEILDACETLRQAIAEAEKQESVVCPYCKNWATLGAVYYDQNCAGCVKRMTHPPKREWVGLTDEVKESIVNKKVGGAYLSVMEIIEMTEAKLRERNT